METTRRYLAHKVYHLGQEHTLALLEIGDSWPWVKVSPFSGETHSTSFHNGSIYVLNPAAKDMDGLAGHVTAELISQKNLWYKNGHDDDSSQPFLLFV